MSDSTEAQIVQPTLFDELPDQAPPLYLYADEHVLEHCFPCAGRGGSRVLMLGEHCWIDCTECNGSGRRLVRRECQDAEIIE